MAANEDDRDSGHAYANPVTGEITLGQTSPSEIDEIARGLLTSTWSDSRGPQTGWITRWGYDTAGSMNAAANALATRCYSLAAVAGSPITKEECRDEPILAPGTDISTAALHDLYAETVGGQPWILHYLSTSAKGDTDSPYYARSGGTTHMTAARMLFPIRMCTVMNTRFTRRRKGDRAQTS